MTAGRYIITTPVLIFAVTNEEMIAGLFQAVPGINKGWANSLFSIRDKEFDPPDKHVEKHRCQIRDDI